MGTVTDSPNGLSSARKFAPLEANVHAFSVISPLFRPRNVHLLASSTSKESAVFLVSTSPIAQNLTRTGVTLVRVRDPTVTFALFGGEEQ